MCCITQERFCSSFYRGLEYTFRFGAETAMRKLRVSAMKTPHRSAVDRAVPCYAVPLCASGFDIVTAFIHVITLKERVFSRDALLLQSKPQNLLVGVCSETASSVAQVIYNKHTKELFQAAISRGNPNLVTPVELEFSLPRNINLAQQCQILLNWENSYKTLSR